MNFYLIGTILNFSTILMVGGCGSYLAVKGGNYNLGGEGQVYSGGLVAAVSLAAMGHLGTAGLPSVPAILLCIILSGLAGAVPAFICAVLKEFRHVDVLLSSFLLSAGTMPLIDYLVAGPCRGSDNNLLATEFILQKYRFPSILNPSPLNGSFFAAILLCVGLFFFMKRSSFGKELGIYGKSPDFTDYSGISSAKLNLVSLTASGFFYGLSGMLCVVGTYFTCHSGFNAGFGWNALSVSLISLSNPILIIPSAVLVAAVTTSASQFSLMHNFGFDTGSLIQSLLLFAIILLVVRRRKGGRK